MFKTKHISIFLATLLATLAHADDSALNNKLLKTPVLGHSQLQPSSQRLQNTNLLTGMVGENPTLPYLIIENQSKTSQQKGIADKASQADKASLPAVCKTCI